MQCSLVPRPFPFLRAPDTRETRARGKIRIFPRARVSRVPGARKNGKGLGTRLHAVDVKLVSMEVVHAVNTD